MVDITGDYDGGSVGAVLDCSDQMNIRLELAADPPCEIEGGKAFKQHFCFTVKGIVAGSPLAFSFVNAGGAMCAEDLAGYQCVFADGVDTADPKGECTTQQRLILGQLLS